ncbi:hypothetical protein FRC17_000103, partial [Serendipita sp. 399]
MITPSFLLGALSFAGYTLGHTIFQQVWVNGVTPGHLKGIRYPNYDGPINDVTTNDIICNGGPNPLVTPYDTTIIDVPAGATVTAEFHHTLTSAGTSDGDEPISPSHKGPIMVYLAKVPSALQTTVTGLQWFKIYEDGLHSDGTWAVDTMITNKGKVNFQMPVCVPSGEYLMRVELIALHAAGSSLGAQFYMECAQIRVTGGGSASPATVSFPGAYGQSDPGILINIYQNLSSYPIPGPRPLTCSGTVTQASSSSRALSSIRPRPLVLQALRLALDPRARVAQAPPAPPALEVLLSTDNVVVKDGLERLLVRRERARFLTNITAILSDRIMHLVSTYLPPTATSHAVKCKLGEELLIVARINRLDAYKLLPHGIELLTSLEVLARVAALHEISPDDGPGALFVVTDHPDCTALIVEYSVMEKKLFVQSSYKLNSPIKRPLSGCTVCAVSANRQYAAVALYLGSMNIFSFERENGHVSLGMRSESSISELLLSSFALVPSQSDDEMQIGLLYRTHSGETKLSFKAIDEETLDISRDGHIVDLTESEFRQLIPMVSQEGGGLLIIGGDQIQYHEPQVTDRKQKSPIRTAKVSDFPQGQDRFRSSWQYSDITGYGMVDGERVFLSDKYGKLIMVVLDRAKESVQTHFLGEASSASCIAYLNAGVIFLGSETGDSQLVQITSSGNVEIIDVQPNIAPIIDCALVDIDKSGDPVVLTCSGDGKTGSLRIIRTGASTEDLATIGDVKGVKRLFSLRDGSGSHAYLLFSYLQETKMINVKDGRRYDEVTEHDFPGIVRDSATLAAANLEGDSPLLAVQVTHSSVNLVDMETGEVCNDWSGDIVTACIDGDTIAMGLLDGSLAILQINIKKKSLKSRQKSLLNLQVSTISIRSYPSGKSYLFIGLWERHVVQILRADTLEKLAEIEVPHVALSILPWEHDFPRNTRFNLLIGTGNGHVVAVHLHVKDSTFDIEDRRLIYMGERPVQLQKYLDQGKENVIAVGKKTVILSRNNRSIVQHHINIKDIEAVLPFDTPKFPNTLLFKLNSTLVVSRIGKLEKTKIDSVPLGYDIPISIAYHPEIHAFALGCVRREPSRAGAFDTITSSFKLLDATTFEFLNSYSVPSAEEITKVCIANLDAGSPQTYVAVGTAIWKEEEAEPTKGRILLFTAVSNQSSLSSRKNAPAPVLTLMLEQEIPGAVVSMSALEDNHLAVIVNSILIVYRLTKRDASGELQLKPVDQWIHNYLLSSLVVDGERIVVGDAFQSVTLLQWTGTELKLVSKDYETANSVNATIDDTHVIQS